MQAITIISGVGILLAKMITKKSQKEGCLYENRKSNEKSLTQYLLIGLVINHY